MTADDLETSQAEAPPCGWLNLTLRQARKLVVFVVGVTVLLFGITLIVLPGPSFIVIPAGLAILATEFVWARRLLLRARGGARRARHVFRCWRRRGRVANRARLRDAAGGPTNGPKFSRS